MIEEDAQSSHHENNIHTASEGDRSQMWLCEDRLIYEFIFPFQVLNYQITPSIDRTIHHYLLESTVISLLSRLIFQLIEFIPWLEL